MKDFFHLYIQKYSKSPFPFIILSKKPAKMVAFRATGVGDSCIQKTGLHLCKPVCANINLKGNHS